VMGKTPEEVLGGCAVQSGKTMRGETETCRRENGGGKAAGAEEGWRRHLCNGSRSGRCFPFLLHGIF
jgi:hypothetical protein